MKTLKSLLAAGALLFGSMSGYAATNTAHECFIYYVTLSGTVTGSVSLGQSQYPFALNELLVIISPGVNGNPYDLLVSTPSENLNAMGTQPGNILLMSNSVTAANAGVAGLRQNLASVTTKGNAITFNFHTDTYPASNTVVTNQGYDATGVGTLMNTIPLDGFLSNLPGIMQNYSLSNTYLDPVSAVAVVDFPSNSNANIAGYIYAPNAKDNTGGSNLTGTYYSTINGKLISTSKCL